MAVFTDAQTDAINAQGGSVLVSAAAGSGKTTVLIERIIRMITRRENPIDVDRLLIVTFTRAAASEMKERLAKAINSLLENDPYNSLPVSYTHLRAHETRHDLVCRLLLEKKKKKNK